MEQNWSEIKATQLVMNRLRGEGWVECPNSSSLMLMPVQLLDLPTFILDELNQSGGWMWLRDLSISTLVFLPSIHEYRPHPQLKRTLKRLEADQLISQKQHCQLNRHTVRTDRAIFLNSMRSTLAG